MMMRLDPSLPGSNGHTHPTKDDLNRKADGSAPAAFVLHPSLMGSDGEDQPEKL